MSRKSVSKPTKTVQASKHLPQKHRCQATQRRPLPPSTAVHRHRHDVWGLWLLGIYLLMLVWVVIFKADFSLPFVREERVLNLIPFYYAPNDLGNPFIEATLNVLVFIPLGAYAGMVGEKSYRAILGGFLLSLCFESIQFGLAIGVTDVTDLITNTSGTAIGVGLYALLTRICTKRARLDRILHIIATVCTALVGATAMAMGMLLLV